MLTDAPIFTGRSRRQLIESGRCPSWGVSWSQGCGRKVHAPVGAEGGRATARPGQYYSKCCIRREMYYRM
jgi:hypothetical protein